MRLPLISSREEFETRFGDEVWAIVARDICRRHNIPSGAIERAASGEHIVFTVGSEFIVKIYKPFRRGFAREKAALEFAAGKTSLKLPEIVAAGNIEGYDYLVITQLEGDVMTREEWMILPPGEQVAVMSQLANGLKEMHSYNASEIEFDWDEFLVRQIDGVMERQRTAGANPEWLESLPRYLEETLPILQQVSAHGFLHGDVHFGNLRIKNGAISGLFDFADSLAGFHEYEFVAPSVLMIQGQGELQREFFRAYGYAEKDIDETLRRRLMQMTILYECSDLRKYALRLSPQAVNYTLDELERAIWNFC
jgi:hygromycin-B 7''-O-kinase